ncbi:MAG: prolyl oligopeptidase family serine peptidase [Gemmatimonadota bacterium]|nr:prolyl oligopeptidase family serine peptidase [Gemmatimonadota bacterium]
MGSPRYFTLRWAPDASAYAFLSRDRGGEGTPSHTRVVVVDPVEGDLRTVGEASTGVAAVAWSGGSELLVRARSLAADRTSDRADWWGLDPDDGWKNLTEGMETVPEELLPVPGGAAGVAEGDLWRIDSERGAERLTEEWEASVRGIAWPASPRLPGGDPPGARRAPGGPIGLLVGARDGPEIRAARIEGSRLRDVKRIPVPEGAPRDVSFSNGAATFARSNDEGTWLGVTRGSIHSGAVDTIMTADRWLAEVEPGEARRLTYPGSDGEEQTAWIILPPGGEDEGPHPTVVSIYPGRTYGESAPGSVRLNRPVGIGALQLLASRGYAVLLPSVPLEERSHDGRPSLRDAVLPAVERAVDEGLADVDRLGAMGHSYGGYGVNHLVSQTDRFRAAVSSAGMSHLRSHYGTFDARARYGHISDPRAFQLATAGYYESGQGRMGAPPFEAPERYREASPLTYVDDVETPLLLIHGDQDFVAVQQAEMFFNELARAGKRVRLARYAGEGHTIHGRANVLDMWDRIFDWFDELLQKRPERPSGSSRS